MRHDFVAALEKVPGTVRADLQGGAASSLQLLEEHLPTAEDVVLLASAAPSTYQAPAANCVLALTSRRLIFVAPAPQALSFPLDTVTRVQVLAGRPGALTTFFVDDVGGAKYQLGIDGGWGSTFERSAKAAVAAAIIRVG